MALTMDAILETELPEIDQQILLNKGLQPGKIIVQCFVDGKVNIYGDAHRGHKTRSFVIKGRDGSVRNIPPSCRVIDDVKEKTACLKAQIIGDYYALQVEKNWPTYNNAYDKREQYDLSKDPNYAPGMVVGRMKAEKCSDPRVLAVKAKADEYRAWNLAQAKAAQEKMTEQFIMDQEAEVMGKELRIARAREMAREQVRAAADGAKGRGKATSSTT